MVLDEDVGGRGIGEISFETADNGDDEVSVVTHEMVASELALN